MNTARRLPSARRKSTARRMIFDFPCRTGQSYIPVKQALMLIVTRDDESSLVKKYVLVPKPQNFAAFRKAVYQIAVSGQVRAGASRARVS